MRRTLIAATGLVALVSVTDANAGGSLFVTPEDLDDACVGNGCWTNYLRVTDLDGDHQLDAVTVNMQGLFTVGAGEPLVVYRNDPLGEFQNTSTAAVGDHSDQHRQVAIGDIDGDGDPDIYAPHAAGGVDVLFLNNGDATFEATAIDNGSNAGAARLGDLDDDGDLDLFVTDSYPETSGPVMPAARVYLNDGAGTFEEWVDATPPMLAGNQPIDVDLFDADADFDLDVLITTHQGPLGLWLNGGDGTFTDVSDGVANSPGNHYGPGVCDVDGDGDLDFWVDNAGPSYTEQLQINDGSGGFADETAARVTGNLTFQQDGDDNGVVCVDFDYDGDFDAVVVALGTAERYLENDGTGNFVYVPGVFPGGGDSTLWMEFGDLDGDGRLDLVTGSGEGSSDIERIYFGSDAQIVDTTGPAFRAVEQADGVEVDTEVVIHFAVTDNTVTDEGPRLTGAFVRVTVDEGKPSDIDAFFMGGDVFRAELPAQAAAATVAYAVCAIDWAGNESCAEPLQYDVGGASDSGGSETGQDTGADSGSADTSGGSGDATASASDSVSASGSASATNGASESGDTSGGDGGADDEGGGCSCSQGGGAPTAIAWIGIVVVGMRRRR